MEKFAFFVLSLAAFTCVRIEASILDTTSDMCLEPILAQTHLTMCSKMGDFSECFRGSHVPSGDSVVLYDILHDMYESLYLFDSENCDLNAEFNNECTDEFVTCLGMVYNPNTRKISCSEDDYNSFLACTQQRVPNSFGPCYFSRWVQDMVNKTRDLECASGGENTNLQSGGDNTIQQSGGDISNQQTGVVNSNQQTGGDNTNLQTEVDNSNQQTVGSTRQTADMCLEDILAKTHLTMCEQMGDFSRCYYSGSSVPRDDSATLYATLNSMSESLYLFGSENCDLNAEFNTECTDEFVTCLGMVYTFSTNTISCRDDDYNNFLVCTQQRVPDSFGPCYFSRWVQDMVNKTRDVECVAVPATLQPVSYDDTRVLTGQVDGAKQQLGGFNTNQQSGGDNTNQQTGVDNSNQETVGSMGQTADMCLEDILSKTHLTMCQQMGDFSRCYYSGSSVPRDDSATLYATLNSMSESLYLFGSENCDLNAEFNNECTDEFVTCLGMVYTFSTNKISCSEDDYSNFLVCTQQRVPDSFGPCYFSRWVQDMVNKTRDVECVAAPATLQPDTGVLTGQVDGANQQLGGFNTNKQSGGSNLIQQSGGDNTNKQSEKEITNQSGGFNTNQQTGGPVQQNANIFASGSTCVAPSGIRFHVSSDCSYFWMEQKDMGNIFPPQPAAPGTLFDVNTCGLQHENLVNCASIGK